ncbi:hypothetical protein BTVI_10439 [Pitangus sulphuratus]|nr:hypothetical protein BTVI_10439 [Pitangus sulphuratus]
MLSYQVTVFLSRETSTNWRNELTGRDNLSKLSAQITHKKGKIRVHIPEEKALEAQDFLLHNPEPEAKILVQVDNAVSPCVWATGIPRWAWKAELEKIFLKSNSDCYSSVGTTKQDVKEEVLLEQDDMELKITNLLNPVVFLTADLERGELAHDCLQTTEQVYSSQDDLQDTPLEEVD